MKILYLLILLIPAINYAQSRDVLKIDSLSADGAVFSTGWKFKAGDNADWAKPATDLTGWKDINPNQLVENLPLINKDSIFWLRISFTMPVSKTEYYAILAQQSGASEVYLNGEKIKTYGIFSANKDSVKAYNPLGMPFLISPSKDSIQVLAVRYVFQPGVSYRGVFNTQHFLFYAKIATAANAIAMFSSARSSTVDGFNVGLYLVFFIIHIIFYLFYPVSKSNLYFSLWALCFTIGNIYLLKQYNSNFVAARNFNAEIVIFSFALGNSALAMSMNLLLKQKTMLMVGLIMLFNLLNVFILLYSNSDIWPYISFALDITTALIILIIAVNAVRQKINGSYIIISGAILFIIFWTIFNLALRLSTSRDFLDISFHLAAFVLPVSISLVLGMEFRYVNRSLTQKLAEVQVLSNEKQQILAAQNQTLEQQVKERTAELSNSIAHLKSAQAQLIQSEKMASLGELTAGIAHEIQNPLNFVNNFSDVNKELLIEMKVELDKGNVDEVKAIANDVIGNEEKINHHGKRADAIVKGMLQHSRSSTAQKEPTDINKLADEYLRLAYHGLRAKDKDFNATLETDFDPSVQKINIIPQDIGRVLLNLYNNAFYAVSSPRAPNGPEKAAPKHGYEPTVRVSTKKLNDKILISVQDNGAGISPAIIDKIFQPFFTTKPTGQGTGLGLSLSYDIIKAHGGEIKVESIANEGTTFIIQLATI